MSKILSPARAGVALFLLLIIIPNIWGSYHWIQQNIVMVGHDASGYLGTTLEYEAFLDEISAQTLFKSFIHHRYRPPAFFIAVQPFYWTLGVDMDNAQLFNVAMLVVVILLTFWLGKEVANRWVGLFAALLVGLLPMTAAMARLFYTEMFLTATVALNLLALYKCQAFSRRSWSIIWGISMGIGLLVKWTMPIYVALPLLWVLWQSDEWKFSVRQVIQIDYGRLLLSLALAASISALWFWPNRELATYFPLGNWLYIGWMIIFGSLFYGLFSPATPRTNGWIALSMAVAIASLWYLPYIDFVPRLLDTDQERGQEAASILNLENHTRYLRYIYHYHFGALSFWLMVPLSLWPWLRSIRRRSETEFFLENSVSKSTILWLSLLSAYIVLLFLAQRNARNLVPLLPNVAILMTMALCYYPTRIRIGIGVIWIMALAFQWSLFTFDGLADFHTSTEKFWATTHYSVQPNSKSTDADYWIGPQILARITEENQGPQSLGMLVNSHQLHRGMLRYLIAAEELDVELHALTKADSTGWFHLLASQWILLKNGDNRNVEAPGQALLQRIAADDPLFHRLYSLAETYILPDGETVSLYHRDKGPGHPLILPERLAETDQVAEAIDRAWSAHATLLYGDSELAVWVGMHDPGKERIHLLDAQQPLDEDLLSSLQGTILAVVNHQSNSLQKWLAEDGYKAGEIGNDFAAVAIYGRPQRPLVTIETEAAWQDSHVATLESYDTITPGEVLPVRFSMAGEVSGNLKISARLINAQGEVTASQDRVL